MGFGGGGAGVMVAVPQPRQWAWQAVLVMTALASLIRGAHGEYLPRAGGSKAEGEVGAVWRGEKVVFSRKLAVSVESVTGYLFAPLPEQTPTPTCAQCSCLKLFEDGHPVVFYDECQQFRGPPPARL